MRRICKDAPEQAAKLFRLFRLRREARSFSDVHRLGPELTMRPVRSSPALSSYVILSGTPRRIWLSGLGQMLRGVPLSMTVLALFWMVGCKSAAAPRPADF